MVRLRVAGGFPEASCAKWLSVRLTNCPKPARMAVLPLPKTSHAIPKRTAGISGECVYMCRGRLGFLPSAISIPGVGLGVPVYPPAAAGTSVPCREKKVVFPVKGSTATWLAVGQARVAVETVQPGR